MITKTSASDLSRWLYAFVFIHILVWTLVPFYVRYTLPMDAMEGTTWGQQFEWGYDKNPFLNGWLTALAVHLSRPSDWAVYLFSQLSVAACFIAVWHLAKKILPPIPALLSVLLLEGIQYYNIHAIDFNDNTLELSLWALTALFFYQALRQQTWRDWMLTGLFAGLGMMAKYYTAMLLLPMFLLMILNSKNRLSFKKPQTYAGLAVFLIIIAPHTIWLFSHDFVTINYALDRVSSENTWINHFTYPGIFAWQQFEAFLPTLLLSMVLLIGKKPLFSHPRYQLESFDKQFLFYVGLGPFLLTVLLSAFTGMFLRAGWGQPLLFLWGVLLIYFLQPNINAVRLKRFAVVYILLYVITVASYAGALIQAAKPSSANFPGKEIATSLTDEWRQTFNTPLPYIAGSRWLAGNIAFYSSDHPAVYINWDKAISPWIDEASLRSKGAIFVWDDSDENQKKPQEIIERFSNLSPLHIMHFSWLRNKNMQPVEIGVAFLPPEKNHPKIKVKYFFQK